MTAETLETRTGVRFTVRPATETDDAALAQFFAHVSREDLRFRFLSSVTKVSDKQIAAMTHIDHRQTEDFLVLETSGTRIVANAMLAADKALETAEIAIAVDHDFKTAGLEQALLDHVTKVAKARGIKKLISIECRDNAAAIDLERKMGFKARGVPDDPMLVVLETAL